MQNTSVCCCCCCFFSPCITFTHSESNCFFSLFAPLESFAQDASPSWEIWVCCRTKPEPCVSLLNVRTTQSAATHTHTHTLLPRHLREFFFYSLCCWFPSELMQMWVCDGVVPARIVSLFFILRRHFTSVAAFSLCLERAQNLNTAIKKKMMKASDLVKPLKCS